MVTVDQEANGVTGILGSLLDEKVSPFALSEEEREDGWVLLCCSIPLTDKVTVQVETVDKETEQHVGQGQVLLQGMV